MKENIILIYGGNSVEHEISIITALQVKQNYCGDYNLLLCYLKNGQFYFGKPLDDLNTYKNKKLNLLKKIKFTANNHYFYVGIKQIRFKTVLLLTHGYNCEDGTLYSFFKTLNINVIAQDNYSAIIGQSKYYSKLCANVTTLPYFKIDENEYFHNMKSIVKKVQKAKYPLVIKPDNLGSSIGVKSIESPKELLDETYNLLNLCHRVLVEQKLTNFIELNIAVLEYKNEFIVSTIEKVSTNNMLSYNDKYINEKKSMEGQKKELPAKISDELKNKIEITAKTIYSNLNAKYIVRIDFLYDESNDILYFNEINNIPGSLALYLFKSVGYSVNQMIDMVLEEGFKQIEKEHSLVTSYQKNILKSNNISNIKLFK